MCLTLWLGRSLGGSSTHSRILQPTPVLLSGKSHGERSLAHYSPWVAKELDLKKKKRVRPGLVGLAKEQQLLPLSLSFKIKHLSLCGVRSWSVNLVPSPFSGHWMKLELCPSQLQFHYSPTQTWMEKELSPTKAESLSWSRAQTGSELVLICNTSFWWYLETLALLALFLYNSSLRFCFQMAFFLCVLVCVSSPLFYGYLSYWRSYWVATLIWYDLLLSWLHLQRPYFQIRSYSQTPEFGT